MRSSFWFVVAALIAVGGVLGGALHIWPRITGLGSQLTQVVVPGTATLNLTKPGTYTIFHEDRSIVDGQYYNSRAIEGLVVRIQSPTGADIRVSKATTNSTYSFGGRGGASILEFTIDRPGTYRLIGTTRGVTQPSIVLAVGQGFLGEIFSIVITIIAIAFGVFGIVGGIIAMVVIQRRRAKREAATPSNISAMAGRARAGSSPPSACARPRRDRGRSPPSHCPPYAPDGWCRG